MSTTNKEERFADDLEQVAELLRDQRPTLDPVALDTVKLRAMSRARRPASSLVKGLFMRSRLTTILTVGFLSIGTGGALAVVGGAHFGLGGDDGSASCEQYRPGNGYGDKNHCHTGPPGQQGGAPGHSGEAPGHGGEGHGHGH
jgi:hypothetical protein